MYTDESDPCGHDAHQGYIKFAILVGTFEYGTILLHGSVLLVLFKGG